jgi:chromosome segregation ATPase
MGEYQGEVKVADGVKDTPVFLGSEQGPSPSGSGVTVTIAYHGARDGAGGVASGERILHNTWDSNVAAAKAAADAAEAAVTAASTALDQARTALAEARTRAAAAAKAAADARQAVEDLINQLIKPHADRLAAAQQAAAQAQAALDAAEAEIAKSQRARDEAERLYGRNSTQWRTANQALNKATAAKTKAEQKLAEIKAQIPRLEDALAKARAKAEQDNRVKRAQAEADRLAGLASQAEAAVTAAAEAVAAAEERLRAAEATFDRLNDAYAEAVEDERYYREALAALLGHERQHRDILRDHVRMLTDLLAKLRSIGWSPDPGKAVTLSRDHWPECVAALERDIKSRELAAQEKFDRDTDHGRR